MGLEGNNATSSPSPSSPSASVKRGRDPEDEVYVDNLHSHKRYLSEIMASSLNGLTVGDTLTENLMDSPVRSENMMHSLRDELSVPYSPMSEDSDDSRYYESSLNTCPSQPESAPTSPVSPYRGQKPLSTYIASSPTTSYPCNNNSSTAMSQQSRQRGSDTTEGRFPSSPSDICHSSDLRKTALLRSVQMRTQPLGSSALSPGRESGSNNIEVEESTCSYMKLDGEERGYRVVECAPLSLSEDEDRDKACRTLRMKLKEEDESTAGD